MIDLMIYESGDGGELILKNDDLNTIQGLSNQVYLAWFGGSFQSTKEDLNLLEQRADWWGNSLLETSKQFNSGLEQALKNNSLDIQGIANIENIAKKDLNFLKDYAEIEVEAILKSYNILELTAILIEPNGISNKLKFIWDGMKNEVIKQEMI